MHHTRVASRVVVVKTSPLAQMCTGPAPNESGPRATSTRSQPWASPVQVAVNAVLESATAAPWTADAVWMRYVAPASQEA